MTRDFEDGVYADDEIDTEIVELQNELERVRKQRALLQLRSEVAREKQLLLAAQQRLEEILSTTPNVGAHALDEPLISTFATALVTGDGIQPSESVRGIKRSHSESTSNFSDDYEEGYEEEEEDDDEAVPPYLPLGKPYRGANRKDFNLLMEYVEGHFVQHERYYRWDERRIAEVKRHLPNTLNQEWEAIIQSSEQRQTWQDLRYFLLVRLRRPIDPETAVRLYNEAKQKESQSVRDYSSYLGTLEANLPHLLSNKDRVAKLWDTILPEIHELAAVHPPVYNATYQDQITLMANLETGDSRRMDVLINKKRAKKRRRR